MAEKASTEAISAASSRLDWSREPKSPTAHVHDEHEREFALLDELLDERMIHPRSDVPVNTRHVVAGLVFAHLVEVHALALEDGMILARERFGHDAVGAQLDLPDFFENLAGIMGILMIADWPIADFRTEQSPACVNKSKE